MGAIRLILGDQLNSRISSLSDLDKDNDTVLLAEVRDEATYVRHHPKKIAFIFSAMRHFAKDLEDKDIKVRYIHLKDKGNTNSLKGEVGRAIKELNADSVVVTEPGEYRLMQDMKGWKEDLGVEVEIRDDDRFLAAHEDFSQWAEGRKTLRMEYFYREMRKKHQVVMTKDNKPVGGDWNFDEDNRKKLPEDEEPPKIIQFQPDDITKDVLGLVDKEFGDHFGDLEPFNLAVTREEALRALRQFIKERLPKFGDYQDAMKQGEPWLYHSHISYCLNSGLLLPMEVVEKAQDAYNDGHAPINAVEGFIRQILGWREFIRGIYWHFMPDYADMNFFNADRALPDFFWSGDSDMNCMRQSITETKENAYAHHIQRLMVIGNFSLLAGLDPKEVNEWYLIVYFDAYEWVEMPNVQGMILFADGGKFASKPYAASGSYISKMSDYCKGCKYSVSSKNGENACPFNYLYWDFLSRNRDTLGNNPRVGMIYKTYDRMTDEKKEKIREDSKNFFKKLEKGQAV